MHSDSVKEGLLRLAGEGRFSTWITDDFLEGMLEHQGEMPSGEIKEHFLSQFRIRLQAAAQVRNREVVALNHPNNGVQDELGGE